MHATGGGSTPPSASYHPGGFRVRRLLSPYVRGGGRAPAGRLTGAAAAYRAGRNPTASSRRERRVPEAGRAGSGTAGASGLGVTPATMPSAIPYSSGSAPATTPPVSL